MPPITFLFWNIHRKDLTASIVRMCRHYEIDVLALAENPIFPGTLRAALIGTAEAQYHYLPDAKCRKIHLFARYSPRIVQPFDTTTRATFRTINTPALPDTTTAIKDLWPTEFGYEELTPPVTILRQQAAILGQKTKNLVEGDVITEGTATGSFKHTFYPVAPALNDYRYCLFYIHHEKILSAGNFCLLWSRHNLFR